MTWTKKQKKALESEITLFRKNAVELSSIDYDTLMMSEWPLCSLYAEINLCEGCPVFIKTGLAYCDGTPIKKAIQTWDKYVDGVKNIGVPLHALTEAADWLENEVLNNKHNAFQN